MGGCLSWSWPRPLSSGVKPAPAVPSARALLLMLRRAPAAGGQRGGPTPPEGPAEPKPVRPVAAPAVPEMAARAAQVEAPERQNRMPLSPQEPEALAHPGECPIVRGPAAPAAQDRRQSPFGPISLAR